MIKAVIDASSITLEIAVVLLLLGLTLTLFVFDVLRADVVAITMMLALGLLSSLPGLENLADPRHLFDGFSSNAVVAIIAVMIIGAGLDKTGIMGRVASVILRYGKNLERRLITLLGLGVGSLSSFMQNVGAAALFLPVVSRIHARTQIPLPRLLMPMAFCTICGGTVTLIGSSPLILLNDLIDASNRTLPVSQQMAHFGLFSVAPVGITLTLACIAYFAYLGRWVLPKERGDTDQQPPAKTTEYFEKIYGISGALFEARVNYDSPLVGLDIEAIETRYKIPFVLALRNGDEVIVAPPRDHVVAANSVLGFMATPPRMAEIAREYGLRVSPKLKVFAAALDSSRAGIAELVIPPSSRLVGRQIRDLRMRKTYGVNVLRILRGGKTIDTALRDQMFTAGDTLVVHTSWKDLHALNLSRDFVIITEQPPQELRPEKVKIALGFFLAAIIFSLFSQVHLSLALFSGAMGMVLFGVLRIDEAYAAVDWKTVFLLASLIPLGLAVETSGTAAWIATQTMQILGEASPWLMQTVIGILATLLNLVMSNIGATVLLVPLAVNMAQVSGGDPALFALTVALCASNSFLIPTNQVNALIMGPGGYRSRDFLLAGSGISVIYLLITLVMLNLLF